MDSAPRCKHCGALLKRHKFAGDLPGVGGDGKSRKYGYLGDNTFCSKEHGYQYGLTEVRRG